MEETKSLTERISDKLIHYIIKEELKEGDRLPSEAELARLLDISRTTLRESVKMLVSRNILEVRHGSGIFVSKNTGISDDPLGFLFIKDKAKLVEDLLEFRMLIEPRIAGRAAMNAAPEQIERLAKLADEVEERYARGESHTQADTAFHALLGEMSGNVVFPNLAPIIFRAINMFIDLTQAELRNETIDSHRAIVNAIRNRDSVAAEDAMVIHLIYNRNRLKQMDQKKG